MEKYLGGAELTLRRDPAAPSARRPSAGSIVPVLCGASFKNKGVQALLDAVIDYLPSPMDVPPIKGHLPASRRDPRRALRRRTTAPFAALAFKIATDPFVGKLTFFRVYSGVAQVGLATSTTATKDKRERVGRLLQMHANKREEIEEVLRRRHRRGHRPQGHAHRRHAVRRGQADHPRGDEVPEPGHRRRDRAEDQGRPGQAGHRAAEAARKRIRRSACTPTRRPARRSSPAWASCTSRSSSTA